MQVGLGVCIRGEHLEDATEDKDSQTKTWPSEGFMVSQSVVDIASVRRARHREVRREMEEDS